LTPEERKARTDSYVASIQRAMDVIAENHVYRAVRMLEGEEDGDDLDDDEDAVTAPGQPP